MSIYGTTTIDDSAKYNLPPSSYDGRSYRGDPLLNLQITLQGRRFFKYITVLYERQTFYGLVGENTKIDDLRFGHRLTVNFRLLGVNIVYGNDRDQNVDCYSKVSSQWEQISEAAYYREIVASLGHTATPEEKESAIADPNVVDTILEAIRFKKILDAGSGADSVLGLVKRINALTIEHGALKEEKTTLQTKQKDMESEIEDLKRRLEALAEKYKKSETLYLNYRKEIKGRLLNVVDKLE